MKLSSLFRQWFDGNGKYARLVRLGSLALPLMVYVVTLLVPPLFRLGLEPRYGLDPFALIALIPMSLTLYWSYSRSGWTGTLVSLALTLGLFALQLAVLWQSGKSGDLLAGFLPWSDANGYYVEARRLLEGSAFGVFASRRPLFAGMLATVLGLTGQNLQITLAVLVVLAAVACYLLAREIQVSHGTAAGVLVLMLLFLFYRRFIGTALTENLGLALGTVGFAALWRGARKWRMGLAWLGLLWITLALNARAGAFLVLPALVLAGGWAFRGQTRFSFRFMAGATGAVLLGFLLNWVMLKTVGSSRGVAFSNFAYVLYGQVFGGKGWIQATVDHPGISEMELYALAWEQLRANPSGLLMGTLKAYKDYFISYAGAFGFINIGPFYPAVNALIEGCLYLLGLAGFFKCVRQRQEPELVLLAASALGILASLPFAPPVDADLMRAYAATWPMTAVLVAVGGEWAIQTAQLVWERMRNKRPTETRADDARIPPRPDVSLATSSIVAFGVVLVVLSVVGPIVIRSVSRPPQFVVKPCPSGQTTIYARLVPRSSEELVEDSAMARSWIPRVRVSDFRNGMRNFLDAPVFQELHSLGAPTVIIDTYNFLNGQPSLLIADPKMVPQAPGIVRVCGRPSANSDTWSWFGVLYADSMERVQ